MAFQRDILGPNCRLWRVSSDAFFLTTLSSLTEDQSFTVLCNIKESYIYFIAKPKGFEVLMTTNIFPVLPFKKVQHIFKMGYKCI